MPATSPLNDGIRDILSEFSTADMATSNRQIVEEVQVRYPELVEELRDDLAFAALTKRVRDMRKKAASASSMPAPRQLVLPEMAKDLQSRLPAEIPRYPEDIEGYDEDEVPWGALWTSSIGEVRRYAAHLLSGIKADTRRYEAVCEVLDMAVNGGGVSDDARLIDAVKAKTHET